MYTNTKASGVHQFLPTFLPLMILVQAISTGRIFTVAGIIDKGVACLENLKF
ncbi:MAG: hypothetical protein LBL41_00375 [Bifidobacteriaceae bacterium]|nr:hypothetical protein [Bifidobacteriaceae bacterium]